jgi:hypothetical protein
MKSEDGGVLEGDLPPPPLVGVVGGLIPMRAKASWVECMAVGEGIFGFCVTAGATGFCTEGCCITRPPLNALVFIPLFIVELAAEPDPVEPKLTLLLMLVGPAFMDCKPANGSLDA